MNREPAIKIQHEFYKPGKFKKGYKHIKRLLTAGIYISLVVIVISFAENTTMAFAKGIGTEKITKPAAAETSDDQKRLNYYTNIIDDQKIASYAIKYAQANSLEVSLIVALMKTESNFNPQAISYNYNHSVDRGICQLNNKTFPQFKPADFYNPETNIKSACEYLKWCFGTTENNTVLALAYYNAGSGNVSRKNVGDITLNYINTILSYKKTYDDELAYLMTH